MWGEGHSGGGILQEEKEEATESWLLGQATADSILWFVCRTVRIT